MEFSWITTFLVCVCSLNNGLVQGEEFDIPLAQDRSGIIWYVEGAPQAAEGAPNPTLPTMTIPTPNMSDTVIPTHEPNNLITTLAPQANNKNITTPIPTNNETTTVSTGPNEVTTTVAATTVPVSSSENETTVTTTASPTTAAGLETSSPSAPATPPGGLLNGVESLLWGTPNPTTVAITDPETTLPTVSPSVITKICAVVDFNLDALCPSASPDPQCISLASTLGGPYTAQCARLGLCSIVGGTEGRIFVWKVPKAASCTTHPMRVSLRAPKRGKNSGVDFIQY